MSTTLPTRETLASIIGVAEPTYEEKLGSLTGRVEQLGQSLVARLLTVKDEGMKATDLVGLYKDVRSATDGLEEAAKRLKGLKEELKAKHLPEAFEREAIKTMTLDSGDRVTINNRVVASIPAEFRNKAYEWLKTSGHESLVIETVNSSTLGAFARAEMEEGRELPDDLFKVTILSEASLTKGKKK